MVKDKSPPGGEISPKAEQKEKEYKVLKIRFLIPTGRILIKCRDFEITR